MLLAIDRPSPKPVALCMLRAWSPRTNGSSTAALSASDMPGPSSSTSMVMSPDMTLRRIVVSVPNFTAFSTTLVMLRRRSSGRTVAMAWSVRTSRRCGPASDRAGCRERARGRAVRRRCGAGRLRRWSWRRVRPRDCAARADGSRFASRENSVRWHPRSRSP